jgi:hypothetical protein
MNSSKPSNQQWRQPWQPKSTSPTNPSNSIPPPPSRGRTRTTNQPLTATPPQSNIHVDSNTPKRKGNPQTDALVDSLEVQRSRSHSNSRDHGNVDLSTPLSTLSTILTTTKRYHECAVKSYRVNHKLYRDAKDRTVKGEFG